MLSSSAPRAPCWCSQSGASHDATRLLRPSDPWAQALTDHWKAIQPALDAFCQNLYAPGFVYCLDRALVSTIRTPWLALAGNN
jgi:hypothetical protein